MMLQGKGFFLTNLSDCEAGEPASIIASAQAAGLSHIILKIAEGSNPCNFSKTGIDLAQQVVAGLQSAGIAVWGWHRIKGEDPKTEASLAIKRLLALNLDGYVVDAGTEFLKPGMTSTAHQFMSAIRKSISFPVALHSYRFPNYHPEFPWSTFLEFCDIHMPKVFWEQVHDPKEQLLESKRQCDALPNARTYIPTGPAYTTPGWSPSDQDISDFSNTASSLGVKAINFFDWESCRTDLPTLWTDISGFTLPITPQYSQQTPAEIPVPTSSINQEDNLQPVADSLPVETLAAIESIPDHLPDVPQESGTVSAENQPNDSLRKPWGIPEIIQSTQTPSERVEEKPDFTPDILPELESISTPAQNLPVSNKDSDSVVWESKPSDQPDTLLVKFMRALNQRDAEQVAAFYSTDASQVWSGKISHGNPAIRDQFITFFASLPSSAIITISNFKINGDQRFFTWHAGKLTGETSFQLKDNKIDRDYTLIT